MLWCQFYYSHVFKSLFTHTFLFLCRVADKDWGADFRKLSGGAALVGLTLWLDHMQVICSFEFSGGILKAVPLIMKHE